MPTYPTLVLTPDSTNYQIKYPNEIVSSGEMEGGADLRRRDVVGATGQADVQWTCSPNNFAYLRAFYRTIISQGVDLFYINLVVDRCDAELFLCAFIPGTFSLPTTTGYTTILKASLEVYPAPINAAADASLVAAYAAYGDNAPTIFNLLQLLVNTDLSSSAG